MELYYGAVQFYLEENPMQVNVLLHTIAPKVDHVRVVQLARKAGQLPLILPYTKQAQLHNIVAINEAINEVYSENEQYDKLRQSIEDFENFDQIASVQRLEKHELMEMHRIAALLYKRNKRSKQSIELFKQDKMYRDRMEIARDGGNPELVESLQIFFVENDLKECFAGCLYTCYDFARPDVILELAWRKGPLDFAMQYLIQCIHFVLIH